MLNSSYGLWLLTGLLFLHIFGERGFVVILAGRSIVSE